MKNFKEYLWILILFLLQTTLCARYKIFGIVPNLVLVFAVSVFAVNSIPRSAFFAVFAGLMLDWQAGRAGVNALILLYLSLLVSYASEKFFYKRLVYIVILTFAADILYSVFYLALNFYIWGVFVNFWSFMRVIVQAAVDAVLSVICYFAYVKHKNRENTKLSFKKDVIF